MGKATRESYGIALVEIGRENERIVVLDLWKIKQSGMDKHLAKKKRKKQ